MATHLLVCTRRRQQIGVSSTTPSSSRNRSHLPRFSIRRDGVRSTMLWRTWVAVTVVPSVLLLTVDCVGEQYHIRRIRQTYFPQLFCGFWVLGERGKYSLWPRQHLWGHVCHLTWPRHHSSYAGPHCLGNGLHHRSSNQLCSPIRLFFSERTQPIL